MSSQGQKLIEAQMAAYQPKSFAFTPENAALAQSIIAKYPAGKQQSALMPLLTLAQQQNNNWLPLVAMNYVADMLSIPHMRAYEVATFYSMYNLKPVGKHMIEVCVTTPCWLRGSDEIVKACKSELGISPGETTADGQFTLVEVECLCACVNAPMIQIGQHYYEDLTGDSMKQIIKDLRAGKPVKPGPQNGRKAAEPLKGLTTLTGDVAKPPKAKTQTAKEEKASVAKANAKPNSPTEDKAKGRPKDVRTPAVADKVPSNPKKISAAGGEPKTVVPAKAAAKKPAPKKPSPAKKK